MQRAASILAFTVLGGVAGASSTASFPQSPSAVPAVPAATPEDPVHLGLGGCLTLQSPGEIHASFQAAVRRGAIPDPAARPRPMAGPSHRGTKALGSGPLTHDDILAWEDTNGQIKAAFPPTFGLPDKILILAAVVEAANDVLATHCDDYDYIAFWLNFKPAPWWSGMIGANIPVKNETTGLGVPAGLSSETYDFHDSFGLAGSKVKALMFFAELNDPFVGVNDGTRLIVAHEYAHTWGIHLPPLLDGRKLKAEGGASVPDPCGNENHWNRRVDGQGSCFGVADWIGSDPAVLGPTVFGAASFNNDIPGGVYSYLDLYLMGFASPAEVTAGMSELRYMDDSADCMSDYYGPISDFTIDDIAAAAGPRVPDSTASQKDFRTAWVIIHEPGDEPDAGEKDKLIAILEQQELDWTYSTLGKGTMSHKLDPAVASAEIVRLGTPPNPNAFLPGVTGGPVIGATWDPTVDHATFLSGSVLDFVAVGLAPSNIPSPFGTILCGAVPTLIVTTSPGTPFTLPIPPDCAHVGVSLCTQGGGIDAGLNIALTNALDITLGTY